MNDTAVKMLSATKTTMNALTAGPWCSASCASLAICYSPACNTRSHLYKVQERKQEDPDDIDKVPVEPDDFEHGGVLHAEAADGGHHQDHGKHYQPAQHVQGVEAGHGKVA